MLLTATLSAALLLAGAPAPAPADTADTARAAALAALRGDPAPAHALEVAGGLGAPELVVVASVALDEGRLDDAAIEIDALAARCRRCTEARLLAALLEQRRKGPEGGWWEDALEALRKVQPVKKGAPLLDLWSEVPPFPEEAAEAASLSPEDAFLARWAWGVPTGVRPRELVERAIALAPDAKDPLVLLALEQVLSRAREDAPPEVADALRAVNAKLDAAGPGVVGFTRIPLQARLDDTIDEAQLGVIEAAVTHPDLLPYRLVFRRLVLLLQPLDQAFAAGKSMSAAISMDRYLWIRNAQRRWPEPLRARVAAARVALAELNWQDGSLLGAALAGADLAHAALLTGDPRLARRAEEAQRWFRTLAAAGHCLEPLGAVPIPSIHREWMVRRVNETELFATTRAAGLSCPERE